MSTEFRRLQNYFLIALGLPQSTSALILRNLAEERLTMEECAAICRELFKQNGWTPEVDDEDYWYAERGPYILVFEIHPTDCIEPRKFCCSLQMQTPNSFFAFEQLEFYKFFPDEGLFEKGGPRGDNAFVWPQDLVPQTPFEFWSGIFAHSQLQG